MAISAAPAGFDIIGYFFNGGKMIFSYHPFDFEIGHPEALTYDFAFDLEGLVDAISSRRQRAQEFFTGQLLNPTEEIMAATGETVTDADMAEFEALFGDATFTMEMVMDYDLDATVDVVIPEGDFPDATDDFLSVYGDALGG